MQDGADLRRGAHRKGGCVIDTWPTVIESIGLFFALGVVLRGWPKLLVVNIYFTKPPVDDDDE